MSKLWVEILFINFYAIPAQFLLKPRNLAQTNYAPNASLQITSECLPIDNPNYRGSILKGGYLAVNQKGTSGLYETFWGVKNVLDENKLRDEPILIYLAGGPGVASQFSVVGPTEIFNDSGKIIEKERNTTWSNLTNLLLIDQPVGTGGSIYGSESEIPTNETQVADHLFYAIQEFYKFDFGKKFIDSKVEILGISYGGKEVPNIAKKIIDENNEGKYNKINLIGIGMGNGWTDPWILSLEYGNLGFFDGFIDINEKISTEGKLLKLNMLLSKDEWANSWEVWTSVLSSFGKIVDIEDSRAQANETYDFFALIENELNSKEMHEKFHLKKEFRMNSDVVFNKFKTDFFQNERFTLEYVLNNSKIYVQIHEGMDDVIVPPSGIVRMVESMKYNGNDNEEMSKKDFEIWRLKNNTIAGEKKKVGKLELRMALKGGHGVALAQPESGFNMFEALLNETKNN